jgi:predicted PurR-regulated permease PerM
MKMKTKTSQIIEHCQLGLILATGIVAFVLAWRSQDGLAVAVRACYVAYGILFLVGALAYYTKPRIGSAILIASLLSSVVVAPLVGFPAWVNASGASRVGLILGAVIAAGIVCGPLLNSRDNEQA